MSYDIWPGASLSNEPVEWTKVLGSAEGKAKSTANVERRRKEGNDFSTFRGMSKKADAQIAKSAVRRRGPSIATGLRGESWSSKIRTVLLTHGAMTRAELSAALGIESRNVSGYLKSDLVQGRVLKVTQEGCLQKFALAEAA